MNWLVHIKKSHRWVVEFLKPEKRHHYIDSQKRDIKASKNREEERKMLGITRRGRK